MASSLAQCVLEVLRVSSASLALWVDGVGSGRWGWCRVVVALLRYPDLDWTLS